MGVFAGLMSGTSLDGVDVAFVRFEGSHERPDSAELVGFSSEPYDAALRERLRAACGPTSAGELCELGFELGRRFADTLAAAMAEAGLAPSDIEAVGSHGQTVWHVPPDGGAGSTLQIGEAAVIAERIGIPVIADFRVRDMAAGGHGAPLAGTFDLHVLASETAARAIQNLGGMANVTALPRTGSEQRPAAFDTGPGVALIDGVARRLGRGELAFDRGGRLAARGAVDEAALAEWLEDPFLAMPPPRSTGRERFGEPRLERWLERHAPSLEDALATLTELTARTVADAYRWIDFALDEVYLCGGGARNAELVRRISDHLSGLPVQPLERLGWDGDAREAAAFALLARQHIMGIPASPIWATGASGPRILGKLVPA